MHVGRVLLELCAGAGLLRTCKLLRGLWTTAGMAGAIKGLYLHGDEMTVGVGCGWSMDALYSEFQ